MSTIDKELGIRLKEYRKFKKYTQKFVADKLGIPHSAISDIENGKRDVTVSEIKILSNLYSRTYEEIINGKQYDYYNVANVSRLLYELPEDDIKELMHLILYKRKRLEENKK